jgi:hypothetical protein
MDTAPEPLSLFLQDLAHRRFYGSINLKFESGTLTHIKKEENLKPSALSELPRSYDRNHNNQ